MTNSFLQVLNMTKDTGKEFMKKTQYKFLGTSDQKQGKPQPPLELPYDKSKEIIELPSPESFSLNGISLRKAIEQRQSVRNYSETKISLTELSWLLWTTQGVKEVKKISEDYGVTLRNVPSAGARHAFETFLFINKVEKIKPGIYRYLAVEHKLVEFVSGKDVKEKVIEGCYGQRFVGTSAVTFMWVAIPYRMTWRYQERGYRYLHLDAGHVCQNLYLAAETINCGVCAIAAYHDEKINELLNLDGEQAFVIYIATSGKKE